MNDSILRVENLHITFATEHGIVTAVQNLSFSLHKGETLCIVGESGSGKTVTCLAVMGLLPKPGGQIAGGKIEFAGRDIANLDDKEMQGIRGNRISMIFQEPMTALNPVYTIGYQINEVLMRHKNMRKKDATEYAINLLEKVGITEASRRIKQFPHELSGGLRQRVMIAIALACNPDILIADEPTTALDVTVQAQILELLSSLKKEFNTSIIFITHDMGVVSQIADNIMVMYGGMKVEENCADVFFEKPVHPYTIGLLNCIPQISLEDKVLTQIPGTIPHLWSMPKGCHFSNRCTFANEICRTMIPDLREIESGHYAACHLLERGDNNG